MVFWVLRPCSYVSAYQWFKNLLHKPSGQTFKMEQAATHLVYKHMYCTWCHNTKIHELNLQHRKHEICSASYIIGYSKIILYCPLTLLPLVLRYVSTLFSNSCHWHSFFKERNHISQLLKTTGNKHHLSLLNRWHCIYWKVKISL